MSGEQAKKRPRTMTNFYYLKYGAAEKGLNAVVGPECLYCKQKYPDMGRMRPHLRRHLGIRPFKCAQCNYKHWDKNSIMTNHFVLAHGRKSVSTDVVQNAEVEKMLEDAVEKDVVEIREIQMKRSRGETVTMTKKTPPREQMYRGDMEERFSWYDEEQQKKNNEQNNNSENKETQNNQTHLAGKLSQAFNNQMNSTASDVTSTSQNQLANPHVPQNKGQNEGPIQSGQTSFPRNSNQSYTNQMNSTVQNGSTYPQNLFQGQNQSNYTNPTGSAIHTAGQVYGNHQYNNQTNTNPVRPANFTVNQNNISPTSQISPNGIGNNNMQSYSNQMKSTFQNGISNSQNYFQNQSQRNVTNQTGPSSDTTGQYHGNYQYNSQNQNSFTNPTASANFTTGQNYGNNQYNYEMNMNQTLPGNSTTNQNDIPRTTSQSAPKGLVQYTDLPIEQLLSNDF